MILQSKIVKELNLLKREIIKKYDKKDMTEKEYKKAMAEIEGKTEKVAKESLKEGNKLNESVSKSLKGEKISEKVIEAQIDKTLPKETTPGEKKSIIDHLKKAVEVWKSNKGSPDKAIKEMRSIYRDMTLPQRIIVGSIMSAALKGIGVPYWLRLAFVPSGVLERGMTTAVGGYILSKAKGMKEDYLSAKFHALKYPTERRKMRLDLTKKYGTAAAKRIMKVKSSEEEKSVISKFMEAI